MGIHDITPATHLGTFTPQLSEVQVQVVEVEVVVVVVVVVVVDN
jgi:hypothetical protein